MLKGEEILRLLSNKELSAKAIAEILECKHNFVYKPLERLEQKGLCRAIGVWQVCDIDRNTLPCSDNARLFFLAVSIQDVSEP